MGRDGGGKSSKSAKILGRSRKWLRRWHTRVPADATIFSTPVIHSLLSSANSCSEVTKVHIKDDILTPKYRVQALHAELARRSSTADGYAGDEHQQGRCR
eukprot:scaffold987_cov197-Pinguiococcus_pyrenoidosus.AAC.2